MNITIEKFNILDLDLVNGWLEHRDASHWDAKFIPHEGYMAYADGEATACGFLRYCESNLGILDAFATNPLALSSKRHDCLLTIVDLLIKQAKEQGYLNLIVFTIESSIITRAESHGFEVLPYKVMTLKLGK